LQLLFPEHGHDFIAVQCSPSRLNRKKAHAWLDEAFDEAMILFDQIRETFYF